MQDLKMYLTKDILLRGGGLPSIQSKKSSPKFANLYKQKQHTKYISSPIKPNIREQPTIKQPSSTKQAHFRATLPSYLPQIRTATNFCTAPKT
jgi:hypothetical protein